LLWVVGSEDDTIEMRISYDSSNIQDGRDWVKPGMMSERMATGGLFRPPVCPAWMP